MTWSSLASVVTPAPTSTTTPAPSWPRIAGNRPSGSSPDKVNQSVWQMPVAFTSTSTSPARGPSRSTVSIVSGAPAFQATAAWVFKSVLLCDGWVHSGRIGPAGSGSVEAGVGLDQVGGLLGNHDDRRI